MIRRSVKTEPSIQSRGRKPLNYDARMLACTVAWSPVFPPGEHTTPVKAIAIAVMGDYRHPICAGHIEYLHDHFSDIDCQLDKIRECDLDNAGKQP